MVSPAFLSWHQRVGGRQVVAELLSGLERTGIEASVLYHCFYPGTRVAHVALVDRDLLQDPPIDPVLGWNYTGQELDGIMRNLLQAANDAADEFGEEERNPSDVTPAMLDFYERAFAKRIGSDRLNGRPYRARMGLGMHAPDNWAFQGWSVTVPP